MTAPCCSISSTTMTIRRPTATVSTPTGMTGAGTTPTTPATPTGTLPGMAAILTGTTPGGTVDGTAMATTAAGMIPGSMIPGTVTGVGAIHTTEAGMAGITAGMIPGITLGITTDICLIRAVPAVITEAPMWSILRGPTRCPHLRRVFPAAVIRPAAEWV